MPHAIAEQRYLNRELSWLAFNTRVLEESLNTSFPLLERLNFLAISASNLDEFIMVRVAGLKDYMRQQVTTRSTDGRLPAEELELVSHQVDQLFEQQQQRWQELRNALAEAGVEILSFSQLTARERIWLEGDFHENLFPTLTPIAVDPAHPFPFLPNLSLALAIELEHEGVKATQTVIVPLPNSISRFQRLPGKKARYVSLELAIEAYITTLFPGARSVGRALFRVIRDSELDVEEDNKDFVRNFERAVKQRRRGRVIRIEYAAPASDSLVKFVNHQLQVAEHEVHFTGGLLGLNALRQIMQEGPETMRFPPFNVRFPERIHDYKGDCFKAIAAKDFVVHHPFETFDVVLLFLRQAASDPDVVSIKQTLYRTSQDSPIIQALVEAAEAGKSVTALVELKARFDEEANLRWARDLERAGAQVVYGFVSLKTHGKVTLVTRREKGRLRSYAHFGTGNYHPTTARIYTDLSLFTCDPILCRDAAYLFNFITGYAAPQRFEKLIVAPLDLRRRVLEMIHEETALAKSGQPGSIWAKMNSLVDPQIIDALYEASQAGVIIELVVRGICCLKPGVKGMSENIRVKSIVGRFLEHARIYCFGAGHELPHPKAKIFISSADWMPRNFDRRVEVMVPIENPTVHEQIMGQIMVANLKDEKQSWVLRSDGSYEHLAVSGHALSAHEYFMNNPSLSGRGNALKKAKSTQMLATPKNTKPAKPKKRGDA